MKTQNLPTEKKMQSINSNRLIQLPPETSLRIYKNLGLQDLSSLRSTSREMNQDPMLFEVQLVQLDVQQDKAIGRVATLAERAALCKVVKQEYISEMKREFKSYKQLLLIKFSNKNEAELNAIVESVQKDVDQEQKCLRAKLHKAIESWSLAETLRPNQMIYFVGNKIDVTASIKHEMIVNEYLLALELSSGSDDTYRPSHVHLEHQEKNIKKMVATAKLYNHCTKEQLWSVVLDIIDRYKQEEDVAISFSSAPQATQLHLEQRRRNYLNRLNIG